MVNLERMVERLNRRKALRQLDRNGICPATTVLEDGRRLRCTVPQGDHAGPNDPHRAVVDTGVPGDLWHLTWSPAQTREDLVWKPGKAAPWGQWVRA